GKREVVGRLRTSLPRFRYPFPTSHFPPFPAPLSCAPTPRISPSTPPSDTRSSTSPTTSSAAAPPPGSI
ncbi:MAG: hypothetical protein AVDCRST_MAG40-796, partial [uncultured Gemmatimonadaceae bacterium]